MTPSFAFTSLVPLLAFVLVSTSLSATALAQAGSPAQPATAKGLPMWVVRDQDSTIYITGTIHVLKDSTSWRSQKLDEAFARSNHLWLEVAEIADPDVEAKVLSIIEAHAVTDGLKLSEQLSEEENALLEIAFKAENVPADVIRKAEGLQPRYATYAISKPFMSADGYSYANGVDRVLGRLAVEQGRPVRGMEEIEDQLLIGVSDDYDVQLENLRELLVNPEKPNPARTRVSDLAFESWTRGETNLLEAMMVFTVWAGAANPGFVEDVFRHRNEHWAERIGEILKGAGVDFIAVGAGHLVGSDSLQVQLKRRGIEAERY